MAYDLAFAQTAVNDLEKLIKHNPTLAVQLITVHFPAILRDPTDAGAKKQGDLALVRAYGFSHKNVAYRLVYELDDAAKRVTVVAIGTHDMAYRRARGR